MNEQEMLDLSNIEKSKSNNMDTVEIPDKDLKDKTGENQPIKLKMHNNFLSDSQYKQGEESKEVTEIVVEKNSKNKGDSLKIDKNDKQAIPIQPIKEEDDDENNQDGKDEKLPLRKKVTQNMEEPLKNSKVIRVRKKLSLAEREDTILSNLLSSIQSPRSIENLDDDAQILEDDNNFEVNGKHIRLPEYSLYLFSSKFKPRIVAVQILKHPLFDSLLTFCIALNAFSLCFKDYEWHFYEPPVDSDKPAFTKNVGAVVFWIFVAEFLLKVFSLGFVIGEGSYLQDGWNKLDFIVVSTSKFFSILGKTPQLRETFKSATSIRTIRLMRPLRSINKVKGIRVIVKSFILSIPPLLNVALFLFFIILLLATLGLSSFSGQLEQRCRVGPEPTLVDNGTHKWPEWPVAPESPFLCDLEKQCHTMTDRGCCPSGTFCASIFMHYDLLYEETNYSTNPHMTKLHFDEQEEIYMYAFNYGYIGFDNIRQAVLSVVQSMTGEGWTYMQYVY